MTASDAVNTNRIQFTERDIELLALVCDTLIPALHTDPDPHGLFARSASELHIAELIAKEIEALTAPSQVLELKLFLGALENPLSNTLLSGIGQPFSKMDLVSRTEVLRSWEESNLNLRRKAFQAVKRLAMAYFYSVVDDNNRNPNWDALGYSGPPPNNVDRPNTTIIPLKIAADTILTTDVVIVGSGAGGGVVAGELSAAGYDVIVLEKGGFYTETDFDGGELHSTWKLFENRGLLTTTDLSMTILAGSALGGGTTVNWSASFRTPEQVLHEWERDYGVRTLTGSAYQDAMNAVSERINVNTSCAPNAPNTTLEQGAQRLGFANDVIPRNTRDCEECGFCNFGCRFGAKQGTMRTYLQDTYNRGGRIAVRATVERVLIEKGTAVGVIGTIRDEAGHTHNLTVRAQIVVIAAGALHTPSILMRSGLGNAHVGQNLHLHPTTVTYGIYDEPVRGWEGAPMSRYVSEFKNLDGRGYGVTLETAPIHPGIGAASLSWESGHQHKALMQQMSNLSNIISIVRDKHSGAVKLNRSGRLQVQYNLHPDDAQHMMRGILESLRIHRAAGAREVGNPFALPITWYDGDDFEAMLRAVSQQKLSPNNVALFSAHQMSSCRMSGSPAQGALQPTGESYEVGRLFVADGSVLPTATGVNPMLTIMSVAYVIAGHIKATLA